MDSKTPSGVRVRQAIAAAENAVLLKSPQALAGAASAWARCPVVGLDTEFVRERTYRAALGLVQISDGETAWLVDPVAIDDPAPLNALLGDQSVEKVIHSGSEDFEVIYHQLGVLPKSVADSQIACAMLGQSLQLGYHHAVKWLFGVEIDKDHTRSNWLRRPLSAGQLRYAALDVVLLPMMMDRLREKLKQMGRWEWLLEEVARMEQKSIKDLPPNEAWMRVSGAGSLNEHERKMLCSLAAWREQIAVEKNLARGFVVADQVLLAMAKRQPNSLDDLREMEDIHPKAIKRYGESWLELIQNSPAGPPVPPLPQLTSRQRRCLKALRKKVSAIARSLDVDAALLASRKQLERLVVQFSQTGSVPERFTGWRQEVITRHLLEILQA